MLNRKASVLIFALYGCEHDYSIKGDCTDETWYADGDGDTFGDKNVQLAACDQPPGYVKNDGDCDDSNPDISPRAPEVCDKNIDNDCQNGADDDDPHVTDSRIWYADSDGDGYGDAFDITEACTKPGGYVADNTDCDDKEAATHPDAEEICDWSDNDCDGEFDEDFADHDSDDDGLMDCHDVEECDGVDNDGDWRVDEDFDDTDEDGVPDCLDEETCDGIDNDGDGAIDEVFDDSDDDGVADCIDVCPLPGDSMWEVGSELLVITDWEVYYPIIDDFPVDMLDNHVDESLLFLSEESAWEFVGFETDICVEESTEWDFTISANDNVSIWIDGALIFSGVDMSGIGTDHETASIAPGHHNVQILLYNSYPYGSLHITPPLSSVAVLGSNF